MKKSIIFLAVIVFAISVCYSQQLQGTVDFIRGSGAVFNPGTESRERELRVGDIVYEGEVIIVDKDSYIDLEISGSFFRVGQKSLVKLDELQARPQDARRRFGIVGERGKAPVNVRLDVINGSVLSKIDPGDGRSNFEVTTPVAVCGVRGTFFETSHGRQTNVRVLGGVVSVAPTNAPHMTTNLLPGQTASLLSNQFTEPPRPMNAAELNNVENFADGVSSSSEEPVDMGMADPDAPADAAPSDVAAAPADEAPADIAAADASVEQPAPAPAPVEPAPAPTQVNSTNTTNMVTNTTVTGAANNPITGTTTTIKKMNVKVNIIY